MLYRAYSYSAAVQARKVVSFLANSDAAALKKARGWVKEENKGSHIRYKLVQVVAVVRDPVPEKIRNVTLQR